MSVKINCETAKGGAAVFNEDHGVWASYAVTTVGDLPPSELFYSGIKLPNGKTVKLFVNRETGLVVLDVVEKCGNRGVELVRQKLI